MKRVVTAAAVAAVLGAGEAGRAAPVELAPLEELAGPLLEAGSPLTDPFRELSGPANAKPAIDARELMVERTDSKPRLEAMENTVKLVEYAEGEAVGLRRVRRLASKGPSVHFAEAPKVHFGQAPAAVAVVPAAPAPSKAPAAAPPAAGVKPSRRAEARSRTGFARAAGAAAPVAVAAAAPLADGSVSKGAGTKAAADGSVAVPQPKPSPIWSLYTSVDNKKGFEVLAEQVKKDPKNTNMLPFFCSSLKCVPGAQAGQTMIETPEGLVTHTYDQSKEYGTRNTYSMIDEEGNVESMTSSPLVFDMTKKGVRASDRKVRFDIDGDGRREVIHDFSSGNGVLVFDANKDGVSGANGRELFGENADLDGNGRRDGYEDGFEALRGLVRKAARAGIVPLRVLNEKRLAAADLAALEKAYGLKIRLSGLEKKAVSLKAAGVIAIALSDSPSKLVRDFDGQGNDVMRRDGAAFTRADGSVGSYEDVWFFFQKPQGSRLLAAVTR